MAKNRRYLGQYRYTPQAAQGTEANLLKWQTGVSEGVGNEADIAYSTDNDDLYVSDGNRFLKALVLRGGDYLDDKLTIANDCVICDLTDLGSEKVLTGDFASDTNWTKGTGWTISGGKALHLTDGATALEQNISAVAGEYYLLVFKLLGDGTNNTLGDITPEIGGVSGIKVWADYDGTSRTFTQIIKATGTGNLKFTASNTARLAIDDVSVKKINQIVEIINGEMNVQNKDFYFKGAGSGLPFGSFYNDNTDTTITIASADTYVEVDSGFSVGQLNGMTFPDDHYLVVSKAGKYLITWSMSVLTASVTNKTVEGAIMINGSRQAQGTSHAEVSPGGSGRPETINGTAILDLAVDDQISLGIANHDDGTDLVIHHGSLTAVMIGG